MHMTSGHRFFVLWARRPSLALGWQQRHSRVFVLPSVVMMSTTLVLDTSRLNITHPHLSWPRATMAAAEPRVAGRLGHESRGPAGAFGLCSLRPFYAVRPCGGLANATLLQLGFTFRNKKATCVNS